jgi:hypothetical protein
MTTTTPPPAVPVMLDLRAYRVPPAGADGYVALWERLEPAVVTVDPLAGPQLRFDLGPEEGEVGVWFLDPAAAPRPMSRQTLFAVRGVLEPPQVRYPCDTCRAAGTSAYGPFLCPGCGTAEQPGRVCDAHAVFLAGGLRASCVRHEPVCRCGERAVAWCGGPRCRSKRAWCSRHLLRHPGGASVEYCQECYEERYPACERTGCRATGHGRCEYRGFGSSDRCRRRMCHEHVTRWQIYGSRSRGLAMCAEHHATLRSGNPRALVELIVAGTAARAQYAPRGGRRMAFLPRLGIVRHIFINTCGKVMDMAALDDLFARVQRDLRRAGGDRRLAETAAQLLDGHARTREEDVRRFRDEHTQGHALFAQLVSLLEGMGKHEVAAAVEFSDYRSRSGVLWVRVPDHLKGRFKGTKGATVNELCRRLGVNKILWEKE